MVRYLTYAMWSEITGKKVKTPWQKFPAWFTVLTAADKTDPRYMKKAVPREISTAEFLLTKCSPEDAVVLTVTGPRIQRGALKERKKNEVKKEGQTADVSDMQGT